MSELACGIIRLRGVGVIRLVAFIPLAVALTALVLFGVADSVASIADTNVPEGVTSSTPSQASDSTSSANATITIIMRTAPLPDE